MCHKVQICGDIKRFVFFCTFENKQQCACNKSQGGMYEFKMSYRIKVTTLHSSRETWILHNPRGRGFISISLDAKTTLVNLGGSKFSESKSHWKRSEHGLNINICFSTLRCFKFYVAVASKDSPCFTLDELS